VYLLFIVHPRGASVFVDPGVIYTIARISSVFRGVIVALITWVVMCNSRLFVDYLRGLTSIKELERVNRG
jgi:hypothetical protein